MFPHVGQAACHHLFDEFIARGEIVVDRRCSDIRAPSDVRQSRAGIALATQHICGGVEYPSPCAGILRASGRVRSGSRPALRIRCHDAVADHGMVYPPLTEIIWPVTWRAASGDANQSTARPTSSAVVRRRIGVSFSMKSICLGLNTSSSPTAQRLDSPTASGPSGITSPGQTTLDRIP